MGDVARRGLVFAFIAFSFVAAQADTASDSRVLAQQIVEDFSAGEIALHAEADHQTLDAQTYADLELQNVSRLLQEYAPSQLAKERIDWLIHHPYMDPAEIRRRQEAIRMIAEDDEYYAALGEMFAPNSAEPQSLLTKTLGRLFPRPEDVTHQAVAAQFEAEGPLSASLFKLGVGAGISAWLQSVVVQGVLRFAGHPSVFGGLGIPLNVLFLASMTAQNSSDLPVRVVFDRAQQIKKFGQLNSPNTASIDTFRTICTNNQSCLKNINRLRLLYPVKGKMAVLMKALGFAPMSLIPSQLYMQRQRIAVLRTVAAMVELETFYAFARYSREGKGDLNFPEILDPAAGARFEIVDGHNPYLWMQGKPSVPNSVVYDEKNGAKVFIMTGPNAGGKTTYQQMQLVSSVLAMIGVPVPARSMKLPPVYLFTNFTTNNGKLEDDKSTFNKQTERAIALLEFVDRHSPSLTASDEILVGTSTDEHAGLEHGAVKFIHDTPGAMATMTTHDRRLTEIVNELPHAANLQVLVEGHRIEDGPSTVFNAYQIMQDAGAPPRFMADAVMYFKRFRPDADCSAMLKPCSIRPEPVAEGMSHV